MKKHRVFHLFILIFCGYLISTRSTHQVFEFTESLYNLSLEENSIGSKYARADNATKIGVPLPEKDASCKFRIAEIVGERSSIFKAHSRLVGNFVFLRVRYKGDNPLNRELKDFYDILVKANCKRRDLTNLETATRIHLRVIDRNDASPVFLVDERGYNVDIKDDVAPFSNILRVEASDADVGLNSEIYFSLPNRSRDFFVEPLSGCIRTLRHIKAGEYHFKVKAEDRTSRLLYFDENEVQPSWTADVKIRVQATTPKKILFNVTHRKINLHLISARQEVAAITIENSFERASVGLKEIETKWFEIEREEPNRWILYMKKGAKVTQRTNITLTIGEDYKMFFPDENSPVVSNLTVIVPIEFISERSIRLIDADLTPVIILDRMVPINLIVKRVRAELSNPDDVPLLRYRIQYEPNKTIPFAIGAKNGILRVSSKPGYERQFNFSVVAYLHGVSTVISSKPMSVSVLILDGNLHAPIWPAKWMRQEPIAIKSGQKTNEVILKVEASDQDEGDNGHVVYKITAESDNLPINIDAKTGEIYISEWFADTASKYWPVTVWAMDLGTPMSRMSMLNLVFYKNGSNIPAKPKPVIVSESANLYAPQFTSFPDVVEISEDAPVGTILTQLVAVDKDFGYNGRIRYLIHDIKDFSEEILNIDINNGVVSIASDLSLLMRENMETMDLDVQISATDAGTPPKSCSKTLKLRVIDVNNHSPQFEEPMYYTRINEFEDVGKFVAKVSATDFDGGKNGQVRYYLAKNDNELLNIDETTGNITLARKLDREEHNIYTSIVIATDNGNPAKLAFTNFTVIVEDANDNAPKCVNLISRVQIPEDLPHGAFVTCISALDLDSGLNSKLKYSVINETLLNIPFRIDHHSGCLFIHAPEVPLDFQKIPYYNISVDVADHGTPVLSTTCYLNIDIVNVITSNFAIEFDDVAKEASVYENSEIGSEVIMIEAKELTDGRQRRKGIEYDIIGGDGWGFFSIDNTGTVRTSSLLDREFRSSYWITVEAKFLADEVNLRRSVSARRRSILHVFIRILDRNDHRPIPKKPMYFADVPENSIANVVIAKIEATDADDVENDGASPLTYKIERGDPQSFFRIDVTSGYITTSGVRRLDREKQAEHELWVVICDGGEPSLCSNVVVLVKVTDENDNAPTFTQAVYHYNVRPMFVGQICRIFAVDADSGLNADLYYNITEGDPRFSIDENGNIATSEIIHADESYALTVQATDCGINSQFSATRVIFTASGNTNVSKKPSTNNSVPTISGKKSDYVIPISDADQVGLTVGKLEAIDEDGDDLWWEIISGNVKSVFDIRKDNGQLLLAKKVENLERGEIKLNISVTDGIYSDYTIVTIQVSRQITQRPRFSASHYQTDVSERTAIGTQIYTLKATGETSGPGSKPLVYSLFSIDDVAMEDKIRVEPSSGNVVIMEPLDFEKSRHFHAIVQVQHAGLRSFATFLVNINDENDNAPFFVEKTRSLFVDESTSVGDTLCVLKAFDKDRGQNTTITYTIVSGNEEEYFKINSVSGEVSLARRIDLSQHVETFLRIQASDSVENFLKDIMDVRIRNLNGAPRDVTFERNLFRVFLSDSTPPGTPFLVLTVLYYRSVNFSFIGNCSYFQVHPLSGAIYLSMWLSKEHSTSISCLALVEGENGSKDQAKIVVRVVRTNQNSPVFRQQVYRGTIRENSSSGSAVLSESFVPLTVKATDDDNGPNGLVKYRILDSAAMGKFFFIDQFTGAVFTREVFDFEDQKEYQFYVQAYDMGQPSRQSLMPAMIIVSVVDENDESPSFTNNTVKSRIIQPSADGVHIAMQTALDKDTVGRLRYFFKDNLTDQMFAVDSRSGEITVKNSTILASTMIEVFVTDGLHQSSYRLDVEVLPVNNLSTEFKFSRAEYEGTIMENTTYSPDHVILKVSTKGPKAHIPVLFSNISPSLEFFVHPLTGVISATGIPIDREKNSIICFVVTAKTIETTPQVAQSLVTIRVKDFNDEMPKFTNIPYDVSVHADAEIGSKLLTITAEDNDEGDNRKIRYISENIPDLLTLEGADVVLKRKLSIPVDLNFSIVAQDLGNPMRSSVEFVNIRVVDKNQPIFEQNVYTSIIAKNQNKNAVLAKVTARSNPKMGSRRGKIGYEIVDSDGNFSLNFDTGEVRATTDLPASDVIEIEAFEVTRPKLRARTTLTIIAHEELAPVPVFQQSNYTVTIPESMPVGHLLMTIQAELPDIKDRVVYSMLSSDHSSNFVINPDTGEIVILKPLDYETQEKYEMNIIATSQTNSQAIVPLVVIIDDVNDEVPFFLKSKVSAFIDDASIPGQLITIMSATDLDTVSSIEEGNGKQKLFFEIVEGDESLFNITNDAGIVTLARSIESFDLSEDNTRKTLNVSVTDGIFTAYAQLCIEFLRNGAMQEPPRFRQNNYVVSALENTVINGSTLLIVSVKGGIAPLRFSLGSGSSDIHVSKWKWPVSIDTQTGRVHLSRVLNYHRDKRYEIPLVVEDANKRRAFSMLTLSVIDVNDKPPVFVLPFYSTSVSESAKEGDTVLMVSAIDDDENDEIEYSLIDDSETTFFKVHPRQGTVTVARQLEHKAGTILSLTIKATDSANPPHHATTSLEINVVSEAFKVPVFSNSHYLFSVLEDAAVGNVIGRVQQMEAEIDEVRFNIVEPVTNFPFSVERSTGKIVVKSALDKENRERWKMAIRADAAGGVHTIATVTIDVIDVNDNAPEFQGFYEQLTVSEDAAIGTSVTIFSAMDKDDSPSGKILFSLVEDSKNFQIDENSGWLTVASTLDREENAQYKLIVRATDEGGFNTELPISVVVTDVNDSPPRFEKSQFLVDLNSSAAISDLVFRFKVNDDDLAPNNISQLFITSGNEEGVFVVDTDYGLRLNRPKLLDNQRYYNLTVLAFDGRFHATSNIIIKIISIDTSIRCTTKTYTTSIAERSKKGSVILEESILSSYPNISFELKAAREVPMVMNYRNGIIKVTGNIDYEKTPNFELTRLTMQNGNIVCEEDINIIVLNENDNHPKINQKDDFVSIEENLPTTEDERQYVTRILATDADGDRIKYRIVDSYNDTFRIDENNGVVTAIKALDSEKVSKYKLTVIVSDGKFEDKATIHVIVVDKNDNAPKFEKDSYSMKVMESESIDYKLLQVQASGGDANETIEYTIQPSLSSHYFKLNSHTGELSLAKRLDFETLKRLQIRIVATDSGSPPLSSDASIEIIVMDENDNSPIFEKQSYDANIKENAKFGTRVITLKAMDVDSEHFGSVSYEIKAAENNQEPIPFSINDNGEVRTTGQIDYEKINKYSLKITAKDGGTPPRMSEVICNVHIEDENDNTPMFEDCNMTVVAQEGSQIGRALFRFVVTDLDGPANGGPFKLSIIGDSSQFFRVTNDLQLVTVKSLQHAKRDKLLLTAIAKDVKGRATECPLTIYIRKESRHAPTMKPMIIRLNTLFNEMQAGVIGKVKATDEDDGDVLKFGIVDGSIIAPMPTLEYPNQPSISEKPHFFRIDTISGQVWADHSISPGLHSFNVTVSDGKFTTVSYVEVHVSSIDNDIIDHAVSIRIRAMSVDEFLHNHVDNFRRIISHNLNLHENSIQLVSVQAGKYDDYQRTKRDVPSDVEILLTAQRGHGRGYLKPDHVYSRLKSDFQNLNAQKGLLNFKLTTEMCTTGACLRGECREMIDMIEDEWTYFSTDTFSFVAPFHVRRAKCLCPDGFGGKRCESEMNECSKSPCEHWQICVPSRNETFECICPLGMTGELCAKPSCKDNGKCLEEAELSVGGDGYFEISLPNEIETRMELEIEIKTSSLNGVIMWALGRRDYHKLLIVNGSAEYHWDAGSGPGIVASRLSIVDGQWHRIAISRRQRRTRLTVDGSDLQESFSPSGSTVVNLHELSQKLILGAKVVFSDVENAASALLTDGVAACFKTISVDGEKVLKTRQGMKLFGAKPGCTALTSSPCSELPCGKGGTCVVHQQSFICECTSRYSGDRCDIDLEPCASQPCPSGIQCIPFYNDYLCKCPDGFTGKHCESRGFQDIQSYSCSKNVCGAGVCISIPRQNPSSADYICNCTDGILQSVPCSDRDFAFSDVWKAFIKKREIVVAIAVCLILSICFFVMIAFRRCKKSRDPKYGEHCDVPHMRNTRVLVPTNPPPLPPRRLRNDSHFGGISTSNTNRPMVQVKPFSNIPEIHEVRSPSACESLIGGRREKLSEATSSNRARKSDRCISQDDALSSLQEGDDSIVHLVDDRIDLALRYSRAVDGALIVGETELMPVVNDDDYMTMKPRNDRNFERDDKKPQIPAHAAPLSPALYDRISENSDAFNSID